MPRRHRASNALAGDHLLRACCLTTGDEGKTILVYLGRYLYRGVSSIAAFVFLLKWDRADNRGHSPYDVYHRLTLCIPHFYTRPTYNSPLMMGIFELPTSLLG